MRLLNQSWRGRTAHSASRFRARLRVEALEARVVPYSVTGGVWPITPGWPWQHVTISFVPDGTILGSSGGSYIYSNLFATLNARYPTSSLQWQVLLAAQKWAEQTNLNFTVVPDNGTPIGQGSYQQGDPGMGDIRIGGYNFGSSVLAQAYLPPPINNYSIAGDIQLNTGQSWSMNGDPGGSDLFTVIAHELGHALGLGHSSTYWAEMYGAYVGIKWGLNSDDIAGIRNLYSANASRTTDPWDSGGGNDDSFLTAADFSPFINTSTLTFVGGANLDISSPTDVDMYKFYAPSGASGTLQVHLQTNGISQLDPTLTLYNALLLPIGSVSAAYQGGATLNLTVTGITPGQLVYVRVAATGGDGMTTGSYGLSMSWGSNPPPGVALPFAQLANGNPIQSGGSSPEQGGSANNDAGGSDTFSTTPDLPTAASAAGEHGPTRSETARQLGGLLLANADRTSLVVAPAQSVVPMVAVPLAAAPVAWLPVAVVPETPHSGTGQSSMATTEEIAPEVPSADPTPSPGLPEKAAPALPEAQPEHTPAALWRRASEFCFAGSDPTVSSPDVPNPLDGAVVGTAEEMLQTAALLAGLTALGSGTWRVHPEEPERHRRRCF